MQNATYSRYGTAVIAANENDSITAALEVIGDRWSLLILRGVFRGLHRFGELRDDLGIASNLLTDRLGRLVDNNVLEKVAYQDRPTRFEYRLTESGRALSPVLISIMQWGDVHRPHTPTPTTLVHADCNGTVENITRCSTCQEILDAHQIRRAEERTDAV